jgi:hypothetical protein
MTMHNLIRYGNETNLYVELWCRSAIQKVVVYKIPLFPQAGNSASCAT